MRQDRLSKNALLHKEKYPIEIFYLETIIDNFANKKIKKNEF